MTEHSYSLSDRAYIGSCPKQHISVGSTVIIDGISCD